jgi:protein phosphatase 1 regulatory subunit 37
MASGTSSPIITSPASSSAVTIPVPGKSILKRPPPPQQSFFSLARLSKLLPAAPPVPEKGAEGDAKALKRAHFILPQLATVYPISAANPPSMPTLKEEKRSIEQREAERRRRIVRGNNYVALPGSESGDPTDDWWSMEKVESFYRECCESREETPNPSISAALKVC